MADTDTTQSPVAADLADERLIKTQGLAGYAKLVGNRLRSGELGSLPVIIGLIVISIGFYSAEAVFLSSRNLVAITQFAAPTGIIALGIVLVLLLGEIDLSVGSVSGLAAASMAVLVVEKGYSMFLAILAAMAIGLLIGLLYAVLYTRIGVPSFVFSLAGLLGFQGLLLYVLGKNGTINLPNNSFLVEYTRFKFVGDTASYVLVAAIVLLYLAAQAWGIVSRQRAGLSAPAWQIAVAKTAALAIGLGFLTYYINIDRGWSYLWLFFVLLVVVMDLALRKTRWGRHLFAVGGNVEAARRSGIKVNRVYISVFCLCSMLRRSRRSAGRGAADLGVPGQRHHRHQPHRDRCGRHRRHQPLRWARYGVLGAARHHRAAGDHQRAEPGERGLVGAVHGHRRRAAARRGDRLRVATSPLQQRTRLTG